MATSLKEFSTTANDNSAVGSANVAEGCPPSGINNAIRQLIAYVVDWFMNTDTIASASTTDLGSKTASYLSVTGTTTITAFGTPTNKVEYTLVFAGALTLTHNATSLILPTGANITTAAGDTAVFRHEGSGNWRCISYQRKDGTPLVGLQSSDITGKTAITSIDGTADYLLVSDGSDSGNLKKVLTKYVSPYAARFYAEYTSNSDLAATSIPIDDTTPLVSEGIQVMTLENVATTTATQRVRARFSGFFTTTSSPTPIVFAMFRGSTFIQATLVTCQYDLANFVFMEVEVAPGSATTETYSVRMGNPNKVRFNGSTSARYFGGGAKTVLVAEVIEP